MVLAWYRDNLDDDPTGQHHLQPPQFVNTDQITSATGVVLLEVNLDNPADDTASKLKADRGYTYEDQVEIAEGKMENYEEKMKGYRKEHLHPEEEIRVILEGSVYFDVRDKEDKWARIHCTRGDLIILPPGVYHRLAHDEKKYVKVRRLFKKEPVWSSINRDSS